MFCLVTVWFGHGLRSDGECCIHDRISGILSAFTQPCDHHSFIGAEV